MSLRALRLTFIAIALTIAAPPGLSQSFPSKPVQVIVGFAPGGIADLLARVASKVRLWPIPAELSLGSIAARMTAIQMKRSSEALRICRARPALGIRFEDPLMAVCANSRTADFPLEFAGSVR